MTAIQRRTLAPRLPMRAGHRRASALAYMMLIGTIAVFMFPLYWSFVVASRDNSALAETTPPLTPGGHLFENIRRVFDTIDFWQAILNSLIVSGTVTVSNVLLSSLAGFAFGHLRFPGRNLLFVAVLATTMVPAQLGVIPLFMLIAEFGWYGKLQAVIVPGLMSAFSVFWMRQACEESVPVELTEAARLDGCSTLGVYWHVALPCIRPQLAVLAMLSFMFAWNDFFWPLVVLDPGNSPTVQVALSHLASGYFTDYSLMLTAATMSVVPVIALFVLLARPLISGVMRGTLKG